MATGRKPYFSSRNPLTSSQPSSGDLNFDGALVVTGWSNKFVWPAAEIPLSASVIIMA